MIGPNYNRGDYGTSYYPNIAHPLNSTTGNESPQLIVSSCTTTATIGPFYSNYPPAKPRKSRLRTGFRLDATSTTEPEPVQPRRERRETRTPEIVGGGPMRRRWR